MPDVYGFISYARDDAIIADTIEKQLAILVGSRFSAFLDTKSLPFGERYEPIIVRNLERSDWLLAVFTGEQSEYCGFEVGIFSQTHGLIAEGAKSGKCIACLHDVGWDAVPKFLQPYRGFAIGFPDETLGVGAVPPEKEDDFWWSSPIAGFLRDFCEYKELYVPDQLHFDIYKSRIIEAARKISNAFRLAKSNDVKEDTPCQLTMELKIACPVGAALDRVPADAKVSGSSQTFAILGLNPPASMDNAPRQVTWEELCARLMPDLRPDVPWLEKLENDVVNAASKRALSGEDVTFRGSDGRIYRPILSRHQLYVNGARRFYILFVETLNRQFLGRHETSVLLISLVMASRFYFKYFENWDATWAQRFDDSVSAADFTNSCRQLRYDIDRMEHEAIEFGIGDPAALIAGFGFDNKAKVESFFVDWKIARDKLFVVLPLIREVVPSDRRAELRDSVLDFFRATRLQNARFLKLAVDAYGREILRAVDIAQQLVDKVDVAGESYVTTLPNPAVGAKSNGRRAAAAGAEPLPAGGVPPKTRRRSRRNTPTQ